MQQTPASHEETPASQEETPVSQEETQASQEVSQEAILANREELRGWDPGCTLCILIFSSFSSLIWYFSAEG